MSKGGGVPPPRGARPKSMASLPWCIKGTGELPENDVRTERGLAGSRHRLRKRRHFQAARQIAGTLDGLGDRSAFSGGATTRVKVPQSRQFGGLARHNDGFHAPDIFFRTCRAALSFFLLCSSSPLSPAEETRLLINFDPSIPETAL